MFMGENIGSFVASVESQCEQLLLISTSPVTVFQRHFRGLKHVRNVAETETACMCCTSGGGCSVSDGAE